MLKGINVSERLKGDGGKKGWNFQDYLGLQEYGDYYEALIISFLPYRTTLS